MTISVHCNKEATPLHGKIDVALKSEDNRLKIAISDTGCGVPEEKLPKLGTSFFSTKKDGTGIGLMVTYNIIKNHHGTINVISKEGKGTTFFIECPQEYFINIRS